MKALIARATLVTLLALGGTAAALANDSCGMNSNKPCPEKLNSKEPAYKSMNSNKPTAQRTSDSAATKDVQAKESSETAARATLSSAGVTAKDLKMPPPPKENCGLNSPTACADQGTSTARTDVDAKGSEPTTARATLGGVTGEDLKVKPKPPTHEKESVD